MGLGLQYAARYMRVLVSGRLKYAARYMRVLVSGRLQYAARYMWVLVSGRISRRECLGSTVVIRSSKTTISPYHKNILLKTYDSTSGMICVRHVNP
jgi:hypothetical protein